MGNCKDCGLPAMPLADIVALFTRDQFWHPTYAFPEGVCPLPEWLTASPMGGFQAQMLETVNRQCSGHAADWHTRYLSAEAALAAVSALAEKLVHAASPGATDADWEEWDGLDMPGLVGTLGCELRVIVNKVAEMRHPLTFETLQ